MQDFKNLTVWQMARQLTKSIYTLIMDFPGSEEFGLKSITAAMQEHLPTGFLAASRSSGSFAG
jgi:23S rRNA-intervening sequence protein